MQLLHLLLVSPAAAAVLAGQKCRSTPSDASWPSATEWASLNASIDGRLLRTVPAASSCYAENPFGSTLDCQDVSAGWGNGTWHSMQPESVDYPLYANNSCLPDEASGYSADRGCTIGGYAQYIVNATTEQHVATALKWASERNIRITVKGTGHDLNARYVSRISYLARALTDFSSLLVDPLALGHWLSGLTSSAPSFATKHGVLQTRQTQKMFSSSAAVSNGEMF